MLDMRQIPGAAVGAVPTPEAGRAVLFIDENNTLRAKLPDGTVVGVKADELLKKTVTVTGPASGGTASAPHGLQPGKIVGMTATLIGAVYIVGADYGTNTGLRFSAYITAAGCSVVTLPGEGSEVANRPVKFLIWYLP